jgi:hypothetical protein
MNTFFLLVWTASATPGQVRLDAETLFEAKIRPVLAGTCFRCHGGEKVSGHLRVDNRAALLKGGDSGPAIVPGDPEKSLLIQAIQHRHEKLRMPPDKRLANDVVADFVAWVRQGAPWPQVEGASKQPFVAQRHWAFQPVQLVEPPPDPTGWAAQPIDRFVMAKLRQHGLKPARPADRRTLLRRLSFDLIGLPPTPEETARFLADDSPDAYGRVVERLLASPLYGERWGRHWMDVVHYADTAGDNADYPIPEVHLYRDYLIEAFNADKPYDRFVQEQLAGDLLARSGPRERYAEQVIATGFLALTRRYATAPYELWHLSLEDAIATTGSAFLGLTLRCARCHDHKFDPLTQEDYYALYSIFAATTFPYTGSEEFASMNKPREHFVPLVPPEQAAPRLEAHRKKLAQLQEEIHLLEQPSSSPEAKTRLKGLQSTLRQLQRSGLPPDVPVAYAVSDGKPVPIHLQRQGNPETPGPLVARGVPKFLADSQVSHFPAAGSGRLEFARWLTRPEHPLTARVLVNRLWQHHFGEGIVRTPSNFGLRGEAPSHPELLDWLASEFTRSGWSIKAMHRVILRSKTYQMASVHDAANAAADPANRWRWRQDRRRLDAEAIRDTMLFVSGHLDTRRPGAHPFPPIAQWGWTQHNPFKDVYPSRHRSVYLMTQRLQRHPFLALFDGPDTNHSTERRSSSTVPLQALYLMNNPFVREQAEGLARRLMAVSMDPARRIEEATERAWGRPPTPDEIAKGCHYVERYRQELVRSGAPADRVELEAWTSFARVLLCANEFVYVE